jgi:hypothetical protein
MTRRHRGWRGACGRSSPECPYPDPSTPTAMCTCTHRATCCTCVCDLTGFVRERGDSVDAPFARPVSVAGTVRQSVPPRDMGHATDCVGHPWRGVGRISWFLFHCGVPRSHSSLACLSACSWRRGWHHPLTPWRSSLPVMSYGDRCWLWLSCLRNRHDNPDSRVSVALSPESPRRSRKTGNPCAGTIC